MENNRRSLFGVLQEIGKAADGRRKKGRQHSLGNILTLVTLGYLMGIEHIRRMMFFFDKGTLFEAPANEDGHVEHRTDRAKAKACMGKAEVAQFTKDQDRWQGKAEKEARTNLELLRTYVPGVRIPCHSTVSRALKAANSKEILVGLYELFASMVPEGQKRHLAIDGKALRCALNKALENHSLYILNVYDVAARLFITSYKVGDKKNEASTLINDEIVNILIGKPSIVTMDAAGTQQELIKLMVSLGSDYVLPVKGNQKSLQMLLAGFFMDQVYDRTEEIQSYVDLDGHDEYEMPGKVITPTVISAREEANENASEDYVALDIDENSDEEAQEEGSLQCEEMRKRSGILAAVAQTLFGGDSIPLFHDQFYYPTGIKPSTNDKEKYLIWASYDGMYIPMVKNGERYERNEYLVIHSPEVLDDAIFRERFPSVKCIILVNRFRMEQKYDKKLGKHWELSFNSVPYIASFEIAPEDACHYIKGEWRVETGHHTLDCQLDEDFCTTRSGDAPVILSALRKAALNLENYIGAKWAAVNECHKDCTDATYKLTVAMDRNLEMALHYMALPLTIAVDAF